MADNKKLIDLVVLQREQAQEDVMCILDGLDDKTISLVCQVIVDRMNIVLTEIKH